MDEEALVQAVSAGLGAVVSTLTFYPLELVKVRLQSQIVKKEDGGDLLLDEVDPEKTSLEPDNDEDECDGENPKLVTYEGAGDVVRHLLRKKGILGLFQGVRPVLFRSLTTDSLYFLISFNLSRHLQNSMGRKLSTVEAVASGFVAACFTQLVAHPIDTITTRIMAEHCEEKGGTWNQLSMAIEKGGFLSLWTGYRASMLLSLNPALQFTTFDRAKAFLERRWNQDHLTARQLFLLGMVTKAFTLSLIYPLIRAKIYMQATNRHHEEEEQIGFMRAFQDIMEHEGILGLYRGLREQIGKSALSTALLLTTKEEIAELARKLVASKASS
mmetsp:Transcript_22730/g.44604  ORF Transcript_22730/g.44604 Transcript_22730/m.44604 type:complete len:328 (-) Transcript_22730:126-1109(-)